MQLKFLPAHRAKKIWKWFRYIWIFIYLTGVKTKDYLECIIFESLTQWKYNRELFILKILFIYLICNGIEYIQPRLRDIMYLDISYWGQLQFMLLNMGIIQNSVINLNYLRNDNVIFALDLVDSEYSINEIIESMEIMGCSFKSAHFVVFVSSHSNDHTRDIITNWKSNPPDCNDIHSNIYSKIRSFIFGNNYGSEASIDLISIHEIDKDRIFWEEGSIDIIAMTPRQELEEIQRKIESKRTNPADIDLDIGEYRGVFHRNLILSKALEIYNENNNENEENGKDYLIFIGANHMKNFDVQSIGEQFKIAWNNGYDVVCANGIKYNGWYYDSFPTILADNTWFIGIGRIQNTLTVKSKQFIDVNSCNGGLIAYDLKIIKQTKCKYMAINQALQQISLLSNFSKKYNPKRISFHVPLNMCLKEKGNAKIAIASLAYSYLGVEKSHLTALDDRL